MILCEMRFFEIFRDTLINSKVSNVNTYIRAHVGERRR